MRKILFVLLVLNCCMTGIGQVNQQTGSAVFSLPMFNWQDNKSRLNAVIALDYNSGNGLRVNDVASDVGQGWALVAGGVITRMQVGEPDDQKPRDGNFDDINKYPAGLLYNPANPDQGCPNALKYYPIFGSANKTYKQHNLLAADIEHDYFSFQFNGRSGLFVLSKNNGDNGIMLGDSKVSISFERDESLINQHIRTTIVAFYIKDENGLVYKFKQYAKTKVLRAHANWQNIPPYISSSTSGQPGFFSAKIVRAYDEIPDDANPYTINNWYLSEINDPLTNRKISFNYEYRNIQNPSGTFLSFTRQDNNRTLSINYTRTVSTNPAIKSIVYPDGHKVDFNYDYDNPRVDLIGEFPLKSVDITYTLSGTRTVARYQLNTTYFIFNKYGTPKSDLEDKAARLCLKSVQKIGVDLKEDEPPYVFDYYTGSNAAWDYVPPPFYLFKDPWGYYNGNILNSSLPYDYQTSNFLGFTQLSTLCFIANDSYRINGFWTTTVNPDYAKNGLLKQINFPTGSKRAYTYTQNTGLWNTTQYYGDGTSEPVTQTVKLGGVHVSKTTLINDPAAGNDVVTNYDYIGEDGNTSLQIYETPSEYDDNQTHSTYQHYAAEGSYHRIFQECGYDYMYPGILSMDEAVPVANNFVSTIEALFPVMQSLFIDAMFVIVGNPLSAIIDATIVIIEGIVSLIKHCDNYSQDRTMVTYTSMDEFFMNPLPIIFKRLVVSNGSGSGQGGTGKTVYEFTTADDYDFWNKNYYPLNMRQRAAQWAYGLPKKITVIDANGNIIKQTENKYGYDNARRDINESSCKCFVQSTSSINSSAWMNFSSTNNITYYPSNNSGILVSPYKLYTGRVELTDKYERTYKPNDQTQYLETVTHYDYNQNNYQVKKITTTQSNGDKNIKEVYYPVDYTTSGVLQTLASKNIVNVPVATYNSIQKNGSSDINYMGASVTDFTYLPNGDIKASRSLTGRSATPVTSFTFNAGDPFNYPGLTETGTFTYDAQGNLIGLRDEGSRVVSNIYDYNDKYLIGSIVNADPLLDKPAYTSFETLNLGGWVLASGGSVYSYASSVTGTVSFVLNNSNSLMASALNVYKPYKLTFWATGNVNISGATATLVTSGPAINGFTYYEYELQAGTLAVTISGNANIDELRLYPTTARMRTVTYDPLVGKTAECDENNRITYYDYDNLGRLRLIKDENRNIIKMYEYNFKK